VKNLLSYSWKYKCEALNHCVCFNITNKCSTQHMNNGFNKFKIDDSIHVKMLIIQQMWKKSLNHSSIIVKHLIACVSIYFNKCKMQLVIMSDSLYILKVTGLTHVHMLIIE
jgi:hypothetical protein